MGRDVNRDGPAAPADDVPHPDPVPLRPLAGLWLAEPTGDLIAFARRAPELAAHVPTGDDAAARVALAIAWLDLVSRQVPPHE